MERKIENRVPSLQKLGSSTGMKPPSRQIVRRTAVSQLRNKELLTQMTTGVGNLLDDPPREQLRQLFDEGANGDTLTLESFVEVCDRMKIGLEPIELERMFTNMCDGKDTVTFNQFVVGVKRWRLLSTIASNYSFKHKFVIPSNYDFTKTTSENYGCPLSEGFLDENKTERQGMDYTYHTNYTAARQQWQDEAIRSIVVRTQKQPRPWLVFTSGPPGAGKTYALSWMSQHGYFPLENIVRVDPDYFKKLMPEWDGYSKVDPDAAAPKCHKESAFFAELAQMKAMNLSQNVWVDTTLKEYQWFGTKFDEYRKKYPQYRIAIFYITAPEEKIRARVRERAEKTGRAVPEHLINLAFETLPKALEFLTPKVDFLARVCNERDGAAPVLQAVQAVDSSGQWNVIRQNFAHTLPSPSEFPQSLAPLFLQRTPIIGANATEKEKSIRRRILFPDLKGNHLCLDPSVMSSSKPLQDIQVMLSPKSKAAPLTALRPIELATSPSHAVNLDSAGRELANIPREAQEFRFLYPCMTNEQITALQATTAGEDAARDTVYQLMQNGGFAYYDTNHKLIAVNAIVALHSHNMLQFGPPCELSSKVSKTLRKQGRYHPATINYLIQAGATHFAWILPGENIAGETISRFGAFAFFFNKKIPIRANHETNAIYFPVASDSWDY